MRLKFLPIFNLFSAFTLLCLGMVVYAEPVRLNALWVKEPSGEVMLDPQTSGLAAWRDGSLLTISDGSAHESQRLKIIRLDPQTQTIVAPKFPIEPSPSVAQSCFAEYLSERPDLEALVVDPDDDTLFYTVTEDASRYNLSEACQAQYANSGSTPYPTVLLRLKLDGDKVMVTHARPLRFAPEHNLIDLPNDGIEGMTFGVGRTLYLGLEKDGAGNPRVFTVQLDEQWWYSDEFADVQDAKLKVPTFTSGNHPINALTYFYGEQQDWLIAAARNDNQIWLIDPVAQKETQIIDLRFWAEVTTDSQECEQYELMNNYSMEGVAVAGERLWLVNDPWKVNYLKNIQCPASKSHYEKMAPLLTSIALSEIIK
ncbi:MAG: hypothetical protein ACFHVJ_02420 [Aestuariibacter sp.]